MGIIDGFLNIKHLIVGIHDANNELVQDVKSAGREFKNDMIDLTKKHHPRTGNVIEKGDRLVNTLQNATRSNRPDDKRYKDLVVCSWGAGDHLFVKRGFYEHHGLYIGKDRVIHYSGGQIMEVELSSFSLRAEIKVIDSPSLYPSDEIVRRAYRRIGEKNYNLAFNNCEHFVNWCRSGTKY